MGKLALAAKITHVPSMYLSEQPGKHFGIRQAAIDGHKEIGRRCRELGVDTIVVFDVHWLVNAGYHLNCAPRFAGSYTSNELPHFIKNMPYAYDGNPALGRLIAETATRHGVLTRAHEDTSLALQYGTLVPMRYMNGDRRFKVVCVAAWCDWHFLDRSRQFGEAVRTAIEAPTRWRCWPAAPSPTASSTTAAPKPPCWTSATSSSARWICAWWSCGSRGTSRPS
jgi:3,4-dihydroxyphenylacetate 2,3-dioxygenase